MALAVRIAVLTYKRPDDIEAALPRLAAQAESVQAEPGADGDVQADIVVVDNDPDGSARGFVEAFAADVIGAGALRERDDPGHLRRPQPGAGHGRRTSTCWCSSTTTSGPANTGWRSCWRPGGSTGVRRWSAR